MVLSGVEVTERPTRKTGQSFKISSVHKQPIFKKKGPNDQHFINFSILPQDHCILRVKTEAAETDVIEWIEAVRKSMTTAASAASEGRNDVSSVRADGAVHVQCALVQESNSEFQLTDGRAAQHLSFSAHFLPLNNCDCWIFERSVKVGVWR